MILWVCFDIVGFGDVTSLKSNQKNHHPNSSGLIPKARHFLFPIV